MRVQRFGRSSIRDRVEDADPAPVAGALLAKSIVHRVRLIFVMRTLVAEGEDQRVSVSALDHRAIRRRGLADVPALDGIDRGQRADAVLEALALRGSEIVTQPEVDGVDEHVSFRS